MAKKSIKDRIKSTLAKLAMLVMSVGEQLALLMIIVTGVFVVGFVGAKAPELHGYWIRAKVGSRVYTVRNSAKSGGGTGFAVKAKSGITYIVTNDHVCEISKDKRTLLITDNNGNSIRRNIIYKSEYSDLCLVEGVPGVEGLELGSVPSVGQIVAAVGHPSLRPTTLSRGEIIGSESVAIPIAIIGPEHSDDSVFGVPVVTVEECSLPKNKVDKVDTLFGQIKVCMTVTKNAYLSNALIQPGSSGSPVVNFWGNVIGVVFAGDQYGWGIFVSYSDLRQLLKMY